MACSYGIPFYPSDLNDHKSDEEQDAPYCAIIVS